MQNTASSHCRCLGDQGLEWLENSPRDSRIPSLQTPGAMVGEEERAEHRVQRLASPGRWSVLSCVCRWLLHVPAYSPSSFLQVTCGHPISQMWDHGSESSARLCGRWVSGLAGIWTHWCPAPTPAFPGVHHCVLSIISVVLKHVPPRCDL